MSPGSEVRNPSVPPPKFIPSPISASSGPTELAAARKLSANANTDTNINP
ncbi:hypothetical protein GCM10009720_02420 [Yaniella flava]|uniref:Uncharacterized protein n=1 Tax=Yaniella flava TaxID=287930 RepID=A0ABN2TZX8_9MICC